MTTEELNGYRLTSLEEPTDEMLEAIMKEACEEAKRTNREADERRREHLKLLFFPFLLFSALEALIRRPGPAFYAAGTFGILAGLASIPVLFYTFTGVTGIHALWADILIFLISVVLTFFLRFSLEKRIRPGRTALFFSFSVLILLVLLFFLLTFFPPALPLFQDPMTGGYGMIAHTAA